MLKDELPAKRDKDRTWRRTAVFTRDEVETIISAESTPDDRRVLASLMFLGAMWFSEAAALTVIQLDEMGSQFSISALLSSRARDRAARCGTGTCVPVHCSRADGGGHAPLVVGGVPDG